MNPSAKPGLMGRLLRWLASSTLTLLVAAAAVGAVFFGASALAERSAATPLPEPAATTQVAVQSLQRQKSYSVERQFIGQVEAPATVEMSFELGGRLTQLNVAEGVSVAAGDVLARLDTRLLEAEQTQQQAARAAIAAQLGFAESQLQRAEALRQEGFASVEALDGARSNRDALQGQLAQVDAALQSIAINLEKSVLVAPFDGQIAAQYVDNATTLGAGQRVVSLIDTSAAEIRVGLPLDLTEDALRQASVEIAGQSYPARLLHIRPDIDPVTRTRTALFSVEAETTPIFGRTARLRVVEDVPTEGVWVEMSALQEGAGGAWSVLVVDDGVVRPATVEIVHATETKAFVKGTFQNGAQLITTGAHRVVPGQMVDVIAGQG